MDVSTNHKRAAFAAASKVIEISAPRRGLLLFLGALALAGCQSADESTSSAPDYNVVLISIDSLRADHVGAYGYDRPTTPFLDTLAEDSVVFEHAYSTSSFTRQAVSSLLTGRLPTSGGSVSFAAQPHENAETLARLFRAAGLRAGMFSNQPLIGDRGFTRGFEGIQIASVDAAQAAADVTANALQFVDDYAPDRFMVYAHYSEPFPPLDPPEATAGNFGVDATDVSLALLRGEIDDAMPPSANDPRLAQLMARYDAEIAAVDDAIGTLVEGLNERGLADDTLIIVTGAVGQEFLDHGYFGDAWTLYNELLHVPLIIHAPGLLAADRIASAVSIVDIYPTLVDLLDLDLDFDAWQPDGSSFLSDSLEIRASGEPIFAELVIRERCVVRAAILDEWKYIAEYIRCPIEERKAIDEGYVELVQAIMAGEAEEPPIWGEIANEMLFNLDTDPDELNNLLNEAPEQLTYLRERMRDYETYSELYALKAMEDVVDPGTRRALCGFGYGSC
ncbi:MAG: sulfatase [Gammaproteobacteria bacterium]